MQGHLKVLPTPELNLKKSHDMKNLKDYGNLENEVNESEYAEKTEKIQVLLSQEDLTDLGRKISKEALAKGEPPLSISHYVRRLIRKNLGKTAGD